MIEIVFSDSACGSLKMAQHFGEGKYSGGCVGVIVSHRDGSHPTRKEIKKAKHQVEVKSRLAWEKAIPMGGNAADVYGIQLELSIGDIADHQFELHRQQTLEHLFSIYPNDEGLEASKDIMKRITRNLKAIQKEVEEGQAVRIWYSNQPDELCGLYWFINQLRQWNKLENEVYLIKLPEWEISENGNMVQKFGWGDVAPEEWNHYLRWQQLASPSFKQYCISSWRNLQNENAPLRAILNGHLVSVQENIYDSFIHREIAQEDETFQEAMIIGRVLGKYHLGIGDGWVALCIEEMIQTGVLEIISGTTKDMPVYHRTLKKVTR